MSLSSKYPNLELIEYKAKLALNKDTVFNQRIKHKKENLKYIYLEFEVEVFPQMWDSTCTGIDIDNFNNPVMAGSAMTKEYTIIIHEIVTDMYIIFFGDKAAYIVYDPKEVFYEDLRNRNMASKSKSFLRY